jgi:anti-sigma factor RsiW
MNSCHRIESLITPFIDGELAESDRRGVEDHLRRCAPCHSREAAERAVRTLVRARKNAFIAPPAPPALRAKCAKVAQDFSPVSWRARLTPYALAASLVVIVGGAFLYQATATSARLLAAELTADHVKCFAMNRALGTHQDATAVETSLAASFGWRAHLPEDPASAGLELVGSRPCLYGEGKIAHIMYRHHGKPVSLFMLPNTARTQELVEVLGHEAKIWCVGNRTFVLLSRQSKPEIEQLASFVQAGLQ